MHCKKQRSNPKSGFSDLITPVLSMVFSHLEPITLVHTRLTNKHWYKTSQLDTSKCPRISLKISVWIPCINIRFDLLKEDVAIPSPLEHLMILNHEKLYTKSLTMFGYFHYLNNKSLSRLGHPCVQAFSRLNELHLISDFLPTEMSRYLNLLNPKQLTALTYRSAYLDKSMIQTMGRFTSLTALDLKYCSLFFTLEFDEPAFDDWKKLVQLKTFIHSGRFLCSFLPKTHLTNVEWYPVAMEPDLSRVLSMVEEMVQLTSFKIYGHSTHQNIDFLKRVKVPLNRLSIPWSMITCLKSFPSLNHQRHLELTCLHNRYIPGRGEYGSSLYGCSILETLVLESLTLDWINMVYWKEEEEKCFLHSILPVQVQELTIETSAFSSYQFNWASACPVQHLRIMDWGDASRECPVWDAGSFPTIEEITWSRFYVLGTHDDGFCCLKRFPQLTRLTLLETPQLTSKHLVYLSKSFLPHLKYFSCAGTEETPLENVDEMKCQLAEYGVQWL